MPEPDYVRARMFREYRLVWWGDRAGELIAVSGLIFLTWSVAAYFSPRLLNRLWLGFIVWLMGCVWFQRFTKRQYRKRSMNQDPPTSRSMYESIFIDHYPERWHKATRAAGVYEGKTASECDIEYFIAFDTPPPLTDRLRIRFSEWRLSRKASHR